MGPEAGEGGGRVVATGTPEQIVEHATKHQSAARKKSSTELLRSYTGEMLESVLAAGPHIERKPYDFVAEQTRRADDLDLAEVGKQAKMPWESDGRNWHTKERLARNGKPCRWDGKILAKVVDRIEASGAFSATNWNARTVVEVCGPVKADGWFFHAITGEEWLLKLKFRVAKRSFNRDKLIETLDLKPLNDLPDLPVYGSESRVKCKNLRGPWQEVQLTVHSWEEVDKPAFWQFIDEAIASFEKFTERVQQNPEEMMPWKKLGQKWHLSRKGFPLGKRVTWNTELLEELIEHLSEAAPEGQFLWNNQQLVHLFLPGATEPWATVYTKRPASVDLQLVGPKQQFALGRVTNLGHEPELATDRADRDVVKLKFRETAELTAELSEFLSEHAAAVGKAPGRRGARPASAGA
ncbi:MAG: hypothetical protein JSS27_17345 [Planctomycetes bacterium]|nr:hypothetical protein [Planctomycetota bacterium]